MKKIYLTLAAGVFTLTAAAQQQLPNAGFEEGWGDCIPWTSSGNTMVQGTTPGDWTIAQVIGIGGTGKTTVGVTAEGYESDNAVKIYNNKNSIASNIVPGYFTLGTTWSTAEGTSAKNPDGGTWGGIAFTDRPESITFMYKRTHDTQYDEDSTEPATIVAYLWKGTFKQADVPGDIALGNLGIINRPTTKCTMENRDRNILGMTTAQGGDVTEKGTLIAKIDYQITGDAEEWTECTIPFEYVSEETPEMINVIFSAGDYWSTSPLRGNTLIIDDVKLNYPTAEDPIEDVTADYEGTLVIEMGDVLTPDDDTKYTVSITDLGDNTCNIKLANFELATLGLKLGDIKIDGVKITRGENGTINYNGSTENLKLIPEGATDNEALICDVTCDGTSVDNSLSMYIVVNWKMDDPTNPDGYTSVPINVTFNGVKATDGVGTIESDDTDAPVEYYNLNGQRVVNPTGLVIRRQGNTVTKVIIK